MAAGLQMEQVAVQVQENGCKSTRFLRGNKCKKLGANRGFGADSRGRIAGLRETAAVRSRLPENKIK